MPGSSRPTPLQNTCALRRIALSLLKNDEDTEGRHPEQATQRGIGRPRPGESPFRLMTRAAIAPGANVKAVSVSERRFRLLSGGALVVSHTRIIRILTRWALRAT